MLSVPAVAELLRLDSGRVARATAKLATVDEAHARLESQDSDLQARRELARPRGAGGNGQMSCPACHRFTSNRNRPCPCGWDPASGWGY